MIRLFIAKGLRVLIELLLFPLLSLGEVVASWEFKLERKLAEKLNKY